MNTQRFLLTGLLFFTLNSVSFSAAPPAPTLHWLQEGPVIKAYWNQVSEATGYRFFYAPYPGAEEIFSLDVGSLSSLSEVVRQDGAAYYVAVAAYNGDGESSPSNVVEFEIDAENMYFPPQGKIRVCTPVKLVDSTEATCELVDFESYGYGRLDDYIVTSDTLYVDTDARKTELQQIDLPVLENWCAKDSHLTLGSFADYTSVPITGLSDDNRDPIWDMYATMTFGRVYYHYLGYETAGPMILRSLQGWANADTLMEVDFALNPGVALDTKISLHAYVLGWDAVRNEAFVTDADRVLIDSYLESLAIKTSYHEGYALGDDYTFASGIDDFNHGWQQDVAMMAYGIFANNNYFFQRGISRYFAVLAGLMREDGSHFFESQRGGSALGYSLNATNMLVRLAELATVQGYDLYQVEINGVNLNKIMEFHIAALEDNELIHQYTVHQNLDACDPEQCATWNDQTYGFSYNTQGGNFIFADFEIYKRRFPESSLVARFDALFPESTHTPMHEKGLIQTCEFRSVK